MNSTQRGQPRQGANSISEELERRIRSGDLNPGDRLPAIRALAGELDVSPATVSSAYRRLRSRGLIVASRRGTVVAPTPDLAGPSTIPQDTPGRDLSDGNPDPRLLPDLGSITVSDEPVLYDEAQEVEDLVEITRADFFRDGVPGGHIVIVAGSHDGVERALATSLLPGDRVAVEDPGFVGTHDLIRAMGFVMTPVGIDGQGMLPEDLERALTGAKGADAVVLTSRAQNPTGAALTNERARELAEVLAGHPDVMVVEDDHAGPVCGAPFATTIDPDRERWVVVRSFGKYLAPDLRVAAMAGDALTIARVRARLAVGTGWVSRLLQRLVVRGLRDERCRAMLEEARESYRERRERMCEALRARGIAVEAPSGFQVWVPVERETEAWSYLARQGWIVAPGEAFRIGSPPGLRITLSSLEPDEIDTVADAVAEAVSQSRRPTR
ncbi:MAG: aminotransferase class I/II-fold pyridoxal phosphate-dependent enzyme [Acidimicrobiia bacterium]